MAYLALYGGNTLDEIGLSENVVYTISLSGNEDVEIYLQEDDVFFPGFIDIHAHVDISTQSIGCTPGSLLRSGVIAAADAGTFGYATWKNNRQTRDFAVRDWISLIPDGLAQHPHVPSFCLEDCDWGRKLTSLFQHDRDQLIGLKIRLGQHDQQEDRHLLMLGVKWARYLRVPLMVHPTKTFLSIEEVVEPLQSQDILTHAFQGHQGSIVQQGKVVSKIFDAMERGVWLDVAHGANHFSFEVFQLALANGIVPHTVSTDLTQNTQNKPPVYNFAYVVSKLLAAGMSWREIYRGSFAHPFQYFNTQLSLNHLVVLQFNERLEVFRDAMGQAIVGSGVWEVMLVVANGRLVFNRYTQ
ncbi:hypothetical protein [Sulfoacidibacillus thermotolerans]|uniref:Amidohydrolase-related domain-containing protein n=1 Tax=Sulfoacidibacillus thermotolerans TaxID=1765684 RepID=A0A2U3D5Z5_SULT2|nr:hypothetical protein [Sulfoacidibacillus thermotolerans]PWI56705.1 hypothetical protein BM613_12330 [Sulfoacidibacillus thermotolerans]